MSPEPEPRAKTRKTKRPAGNGRARIVIAEESDTDDETEKRNCNDDMRRATSGPLCKEITDFVASSVKKKSNEPRPVHGAVGQDVGCKSRSPKRSTARRIPFSPDSPVLSGSTQAPLLDRVRKRLNLHRSREMGSSVSGSAVSASSHHSSENKTSSKRTLHQGNIEEGPVPSAGHSKFHQQSTQHDYSSLMRESDSFDVSTQKIHTENLPTRPRSREERIQLAKMKQESFRWKQLCERSVRTNS